MSKRRCDQSELLEPRLFRKRNKIKEGHRFRDRFWTTLFNNSHVNVHVTGPLVNTLGRSNPDTALESYRGLLARLPNFFRFHQGIDRIFKKKGHLDAEIEFWKTVASDHAAIDIRWNRLMRLFKRRGDVDQAIEFWTDMESRVYR